MPSEWIQEAGSLGAIIGILIGRFIMMIIAVSYGVLIDLFPVTGGGYVYAFLSAGRHFAFITGWFMVLGYASIVALNASALTLLLKYLFPEMMLRGYLYTIFNWEVFLPEIIISSLIILLFAYLNIRGSSTSGNFQLIFSLVLALCILIMGGASFGYANKPFENMLPYFKEGQSSLISILTIIAIAPWAFVGFDNIPQSAEELNFPKRKVTGLILISLATSGLVYIIMIGVASWTYSEEEMNFVNKLWPIYSSFGRIGLSVLSIAIMMGIFTGLNGFLYSSSRLLYSMSRGKALPKKYSDLHSKFGTPHRAIWFIAITVIPMTWFGRPALSWIVDMSSIGVTIGYLFTCIAAYKYLTKKPGRKLYFIKKVLAITGILFSIIFILLLLLPNSPAALEKPSLILLMLWIIIGYIFYLKIYRNYILIEEKDLRAAILNTEYKK